MVRSLLVGAMASLVLITTVLLLTPTRCEACPPITWETESVTLVPESITVDGVSRPLPAIYNEVEVSLGPFIASPEDVHLLVRLDSTDVYHAAFR